MKYMLSSDNDALRSSVQCSLVDCADVFIEIKTCVLFVEERVQTLYTLYTI